MQSNLNYPKVKIAVSNCLMGVNCRFNGGHSQDDFVTERLAKYVEFIPFCPEDAVMGTPRESVRLYRVDGEIKVMGGRSQTDYTDGLTEYNQQMIRQLVEQAVDGAIVKAKSPSCGLERIKIYRPTGEWLGSDNGVGQGLFTQMLQQAMPWLGVEEEGRLLDPWLRENFVLQVFTQARWRELMDQSPGLADFQTFHRRHKFLFLSKNEAIYRQMGPLVAATTQKNQSESMAAYQALLHELLATKTRRSAMINVLEHLYGYVKDKVSDGQKAIYRETLEEFRSGVVPLIAMIKLLRQWIEDYQVTYLQDQWILDPYPADLALRSDLKAFKNVER
jgi:uncharacterized protein YbgA (DUF1722 family)/uncharacterized protein YbbK (DUF523 family)